MDWKEYQKKVATVFDSIGAKTTIEETLEGARGVHNIDVVVRLEKFGIEMLWVCECKYWKSAIPKEKMLSFYEIVKDIGADKGFLFSESGFQSGTIRSSANTNILLTDIDGINELIKDEIEVKKLVYFLQKFEGIRNNLKASWLDDLGYPRPLNKLEFDESVLLDGTLMFMTLKIQKALNHQYPIVFSGLNSKTTTCQNPEELLEILATDLEELKKMELRITQKMKSAYSRIGRVKREFVISVQNLIKATENQIFNPKKKKDDLIHETLKWLKAVGGKADELEELSRGSLYKQFRTTLGTLFKEIYPHLTEFEMEIELWHHKKDRVLNQLENLNRISKY